MQDAILCSDPKILEFSFDDEHITMNQKKYISKVLSRFDMNESYPKPIPCDNNVNDLTNEDSKFLDEEGHKLYQQIVGCLIYLMICTRPDIAYTVNKLSQHMTKPQKIHLNMAKNAMRYVKGSIDVNLKYSKCESLSITGFSDSDWGSNYDRKSISGYCFSLNESGAMISWRSKKQSIIALSSCEAEYVSITFAVQEAKFLCQVLSDMIGSNAVAD